MNNLRKTFKEEGSQFARQAGILNAPPDIFLPRLPEVDFLLKARSVEHETGFGHILIGQGIVQPPSELSRMPNGKSERGNSV